MSMCMFSVCVCVCVCFGWQPTHLHISHTRGRSHGSEITKEETRCAGGKISCGFFWFASLQRRLLCRRMCACTVQRATIVSHKRPLLVTNCCCTRLSDSFIVSYFIAGTWELLSFPSLFGHNLKLCERLFFGGTQEVKNCFKKRHLIFFRACWDIKTLWCLNTLDCRDTLYRCSCFQEALYEFKDIICTSPTLKSLKNIIKSQLRWWIWLRCLYASQSMKLTPGAS